MWMWIGIGIGIGIIIILGMMILLIGKMDNSERKPRGENDELKELVSILREGKEEESREKREEDMRVYAYKKIMNEPFGGILRSDNGERGVNCKSGGELLPFGLSEGEKRLLEDFYGKRY